MNDKFTFTDAEIKYLQEGEELRQGLLSKYATKNCDAIYPSERKEDFLRSNFSRDIDKVINCPLYNRYADKTQVLSFFKNDNITRRASHVQLVSKVARTIGKALRLNLELIEAIALGHDIGHTPFGHRGEYFLSNCYQNGCEKRGRERRYFNHNVQSARYFRNLTENYDLSLQTLSGILSHNGEKVCQEYSPSTLTDFAEFDQILENCIINNGFHKTLRPNTLEGCVVRLSDMIAYAGKDRQDLIHAGISYLYGNITQSKIGNNNGQIIAHMMTNIVKNSIDSPSLNMDADVFADFKDLVNENYKNIYNSKEVEENYDIVEQLMSDLYNTLCDDLAYKNKDSVIFQHHINTNFLKNIYSKIGINEHIDDIVTDYIASMTDDYFVDLCEYLHINNDLALKIKYKGYFDNLNKPLEE